MSVCPVDEKGFCSRHRKVHEQQHLKWALDPSFMGESYRAKWDREIGFPDGSVPEQIPPRPFDYSIDGYYSEPGMEKGLGDMLKAALGKVGVTEKRVSRFLGRPCGCDERRLKLNALGNWAKRVVKGMTDNALEYLEQIIGDSPVVVKRGEEMGWQNHNWAYGVMTIPERKDDLLPQTLQSLWEAGFDHPRLFVDCTQDAAHFESRFGLPVTVRGDCLRTAGNWVLSLYELVYRHPEADRFALFQDDLLAVKNLKEYLSRCRYQESFSDKYQQVTGGYWNLYTIEENENRVPLDTQGKRVPGWHLSNQLGRGAVGLVFSRQAVITLLSSRHLAGRPFDTHRGWRSIDGGIWQSLHDAGWAEYIHYPSLIQHTGMTSSMGKGSYASLIQSGGSTFGISKCFRADFDPLTLIPSTAKGVSP